MMNLTNLRADNNGKLPDFAWPGGYPMYYINKKGEAFCPDCANKANNDVTDGEPNWENTDLYCDDCGKRIESAYGED